MPYFLPALLVFSLFIGHAHAEVQRTEQISGTKALLIAVHPVNDKVVWASGAGGTWARTIDGGAHWTSGQVAGAEQLQFRDIHAQSADRAWLLSIGNGALSRIYQTDDGGSHWREQFVNDNPNSFFDCMDFWDDQRALVIGDAVAGHVDMLSTDDGGRHWSRVPPASLPSAPAVEGSFAASGTCLIARPGGLAWVVANNVERARLLRTLDYGKRWTEHTLPITTHAESGAQSLAFRDDRHGMVLAGGRTVADGDVLAAFTADGGTTWEARRSAPLATGVWGGAYVIGATTPTLVAVGTSGAVYTRDEGLSWIAIDSMNYWSVRFASPNAGWAVGKDGRITKLSGF